MYFMRRAEKINNLDTQQLIKKAKLAIIQAVVDYFGPGGNKGFGREKYEKYDMEMLSDLGIRERADWYPKLLASYSCDNDAQQLLTLLNDNTRHDLNSFRYFAASYFLEKTATSDDEAYTVLSEAREILNKFIVQQKTPEKKDPEQIERFRFLSSHPQRKHVTQKNVSIRVYTFSIMAKKAVQVIQENLQGSPFNLETREVMDFNSIGIDYMKHDLPWGIKHCILIIDLNIGARDDAYRPFYEAIEAKDVAIILINYDETKDKPILLNKCSSLARQYPKIKSWTCLSYSSTTEAWSFIDNPDNPLQNFFREAENANVTSDCRLL